MWQCFSTGVPRHTGVPQAASTPCSVSRVSFYVNMTSCQKRSEGEEWWHFLKYLSQSQQIVSLVGKLTHLASRNIKVVKFFIPYLTFCKSTTSPSHPPAVDIVSECFWKFLPVLKLRIIENPQNRTKMAILTPASNPLRSFEDWDFP